MPMRLIPSVIIILVVFLLPVQMAGADEPFVPARNAVTFPGIKSKWEGFDRYDFQVGGRNAIIVAPKRPLPGRPWAWRGEFFGIYANADATLLTNGLYLAFISAPDMFGSPKAVELWNTFYRELTTKYGFAK